MAFPFRKKNRGTKPNRKKPSKPTKTNSSSLEHPPDQHSENNINEADNQVCEGTKKNEADEEGKLEVIFDQVLPDSMEKGYVCGDGNNYESKKKHSGFFRAFKNRSTSDKSTTISVKSKIFSFPRRIKTRRDLFFKRRSKEQKVDDCVSSSTLGNGDFLETSRYQSTRKTVSTDKFPSIKRKRKRNIRGKNRSLKTISEEGPSKKRDYSTQSGDTEDSKLDDQDSRGSEPGRALPKIDWNCNDVVRVNFKTIDACVSCMMVGQRISTKAKLAPRSDYSRSTFTDLESFENSAWDVEEYEENDNSSCQRSKCIDTQSILEEDDSCESSQVEVSDDDSNGGNSKKVEEGDRDDESKKEKGGDWDDGEDQCECDDSDIDKLISSSIMCAPSLEDKPAIEMSYHENGNKDNIDNPDVSSRGIILVM